MHASAREGGPEGERGGPQRPISWEAFYTGYRKPDYIPGYEIINKLGAGVFGIVFKARKRSIGKLFAIKFLRVDDTSTRDAILKEIESVRYFAQIDHPNLVSIEDRGQVDGIPYIIMGYAGEETLRQRLEQDPPDVDEILAILEQVCRGIGALHERSLVHFDIKPANVYLKGNLAKVGDYGLSRLLTESRNSLSFGRGTPYYMAPEMAQLVGDHRSDIYSIGVLLYECLARSVPFKGSNEFEVMRRHKEDRISFPKEVPNELRPIITKAMAKDPRDRYSSVGELLEDLRAVRERRAGNLVDRNARALQPTKDVPATESTVLEHSAFEETRIDRSESRSGHTLFRRPQSRPRFFERVASRRPQSRSGLAAFGVAGMEAFMTMVLIPVRTLAILMGRSLEALVLLPFRMAEWTIKIFLFILGVALFFKVGEVLRAVLLQIFS